MGAESSQFGMWDDAEEEFGLPVPRRILFLGCPAHHHLERHRSARRKSRTFIGVSERNVMGSGRFLQRESKDKDLRERSSSDVSRLSGQPVVRRNSSETASDMSDVWGFFEQNEADYYAEDANNSGFIETPAYILEEPLAVQALWHVTAGKRPKQPDHERQLIEMEWEKNFRMSMVPGVRSLPDVREVQRNRSPGDVTKRTWFRRNWSDSHSLSQRRQAGGKKRQRSIVRCLTCPFGYAASKSFTCHHCNSINSVMIHVPRVRIVRERERSYAEYLIVIDNGSFTFGIWRRYSTFVHFYMSMIQPHVWRYPRTISSWKELQAKRKWLRCLRPEYLLMKCFNIERLLQSLLAEADTPDILSSLVFGRGTWQEPE
mmetsp:Transcript_5960/g.23123  ORF Transcript_5960/g.23123 Transcript_5960/m.23123 type:complete len:373 (-) Transcript_5960:343-1461(-)